MPTFQIKVITGKKFGAATDANVFIELHGTSGNSGRIQLKKFSHCSPDEMFQLGKTDMFYKESKDIGQLKKINIGHDNFEIGAESADWFLEQVEIKCQNTDQEWMFPCNQWIALNKGDGKLNRDLYPK